jgi:hypothetical protein
MLFHERREDLAVSFPQDRPPVAEHTFWCGIAARGPTHEGRIIYESDPALEEVGRLDPGSPKLSIAPLERLYSELAGKVHRGRPSLVISARFVQFRQRVLIARPGRETVADLRTGSRLRLECFISHGAAVMEVVDPLNSFIDIGQLVERAERRIEAEELAAGHYPAVLAPGIGGSMKSSAMRSRPMSCFVTAPG